jgi:peptidyl-prolyl cis-trans isomerase C
MKTLIVRLILAAISLVLAGIPASVRAQQPSSPAGSPGPSTPATPAKSAAAPDKVVLKVGDQQLTRADLDFLFASLSPQVQQTVATQGRRPVGEQYALMLLLSQEALKGHLDSTPAFRQQAELQRHQMLAQAEYTHLMSQTVVSPAEVSQYYSTHAGRFEEAQVRQVVVRKRAEGAKEGTPGFPPPAAQARMEAIRKAMAAGTDAQKVAQDFGDQKNVQIDTNPRTIRHGQLPPNLEKAAFELKDGELSQPLEVAQAIVLFQLIGHRSAELKQVSADIENTLRQEKLDATVADLKKTTVIWMDQDYFQATPAPPTLNARPSPTGQAPPP